MITTDCAGHAGAGGASFDTMSVHELKQYLDSRGISHSGLFEKSDLISRAKNS